MRDFSPAPVRLLFIVSENRRSPFSVCCVENAEHLPAFVNLILQPLTLGGSPRVRDQTISRTLRAVTMTKLIEHIGQFLQNSPRMTLHPTGEQLSTEAEGSDIVQIVAILSRFDPQGRPMVWSYRLY